MFVKASKPGMYDLAKNGSFVHVVPGTVFQVPDTMPIEPGCWIVRCDEAGNITELHIVRNTAMNARQAADRARGEAKIAADKAKVADALADAEEARVALLEKPAEEEKKPVKAK